MSGAWLSSRRGAGPAAARGGGDEDFASRGSAPRRYVAPLLLLAVGIAAGGAGWYAGRSGGRGDGDGGGGGSSQLLRAERSVVDGALPTPTPTATSTTTVSPSPTTTATPLPSSSKCPVLAAAPAVAPAAAAAAGGAWPPTARHPPRPGASPYPDTAAQVVVTSTADEPTGPVMVKADKALDAYLRGPERAAKLQSYSDFCPSTEVRGSGEGGSPPSKFAWTWQSVLADQIAALKCTWTTQGLDVLGGRTMHACVGDTAEDGMAKYIFESGSYFNNAIAAELSALRLCTPEAPFVLDIGMNLGAFSFMALQLGCHVISFEPALRNIGRVARGIAANPDLAGRIWLLKNAVCGKPADSVKLMYSPANSGGTRLGKAGDALPVEPTLGGVEEVTCVVVDDLFFPPEAGSTCDESRGAAGGAVPCGALPPHIVHPLTGRPLRPADIGFMKIDAEGFDLRILHGMRRILEASTASLMLELHPSGEVCDSLLWADWAEQRGFSYLHTAGGGGVGGSRWLEGDRFRRALYMALHGGDFHDAGPMFSNVFEGLFLRGPMRERAEGFWPRPGVEKAREVFEGNLRGG
jgi:hypothetical protein